MIFFGIHCNRQTKSESKIYFTLPNISISSYLYRRIMNLCVTNVELVKVILYYKGPSLITN